MFIGKGRFTMNFSKRNTQKKQQELRSSSIKFYSKLKFWLLRLCVVSLIGIFFISCNTMKGLLQGIIDTCPSLDETSIEPENFVSTIYDNKGNEVYQLVGSDANRISVSLEQIPIQLQQAFIAIEDERFYTHNGIDMKGIARAGVLTFSSGSLGQGASTITQQLLKNVIFSGGNERSMAEKIQRKVQEQYLALKLEKSTSKNVILENYLNTINLGQNTLGVQSASLRYFDKDVSELTLSECAVIAGITKNPSSLNPISYPENNKKRRKNVLDKMLELSMITQKEYDTALADNIYKRIQKVNKKKTKISNTVTSYFTDAVIDSVLNDLQKELGYSEKQATNLLYRGGLSIYTTQDQGMQKVCDSVISDASLYPTGTTYSFTYRLSVIDEDNNCYNYDENTLLNYFRTRNPSFSLLFSSKSEAKKYIKLYRNYVVKKHTKVTGESLTFTLQPQISFVLMDQSTGQVKALVGGRGQKTASRTLNRATSTTRQPGSTFKVLSAYLPAIDSKNMSLASVYDDAPYNYPGTNRPVKNWYSSGYRGLTTIRTAIKDSMNIITVKTLADVTPEKSLAYLDKLGFTTLISDTSLPANDVNLSTALGGLTYGVTNFEATAAYAAIANNGTYQKPILYTKVLDHDGKVLLKNKSKVKKVMKDSTAYLLTSAMQDVVNSGTGTLAHFTNSSMPLAGKTGTTSDNIDAWFIGYTPYFTAGIWTGYDNNTSLSNTSYHKIIWRTIMERLHTNLPNKTFSKPDSIVTATICTKSGKLARKGVCDCAPGGSTVKKEYFAGHIPTEYCDTHMSVNICTTSGQVASSSCPASSIVTKIMLKKDEKGATTSDSPYVISPKELTTVCSYHTGTHNADLSLGDTTSPDRTKKDTKKKKNTDTKHTEKKSTQPKKGE